MLLIESGHAQACCSIFKKKPCPFRQGFVLRLDGIEPSTLSLKGRGKSTLPDLIQSLWA